MAEIGISIAAKVAEFLVDPIRRQISYAFKYQRNMEELKKQVKMLTNQRESVQHSVDEANRQGDEIEKHVQEWMDSVDEFVKKVVKPIIDDQVKVLKLTHERECVQHSVDETKGQGGGIEKQVQEWLNSTVVKPITDDSVKAEKLCSIGFCPNPMTRYSLSKKAVKMAKDGFNLLGQGNFQKVSYRLPPQRANSIYIRGYEDFASRMSLSERIMEALADADVNLIGVYGMGGVGKTTLVKKVAQQAKENKLFDVVVTAVVTVEPDIRKIQGQIADELGLEFHQESESGRAARLRERMKKENKILVILDNVWAQLDFESIGIPVAGDEKKSITQEVNQEEGETANKRQCKILLTSRRLDVLRDDMDIQKNFKVEILPDPEAESLFWKTVGYSEENFDLNPTAVEIVGKCAGLPVAIKTIANALKNKSLPVWKNALDQLKKANPKDIKGMNADVYSTIELSFNLLENEEAKSLFLFCSLCNGGYGVHITDLLKYSMGLRLFQDFYTLEEGRNKLHTLIDYLKTSCLLMDDDSDRVKMHDIIHAVSVSISSTTKLWFNLQDAAGLKEALEKKLPVDSAAVSLLYRDIYELPEKMEFPKLEQFLLCMKDASLQIPDAVFEGMKGLKVLDVSGIHLLSPPSSLFCLINLRTLCLDRCRFEDVAFIGELKELEILSLMDSAIVQLPREIGQLTRLRLLDLSYCSKLKVIHPNVISSLTHLEELYMGDSFDQWDIDGQRNASLAELKQLSFLTALDLHVPIARIIPQGLSFEKLERYRIFVGEVWDWSGKCETSRMLRLELSSSIYLSNEIKSLLNKTQDVHLDKLKGVKNVVHELNGEGFPQLKHLHVQNCSEIQHIANSFGCGPCNVFPRLKSLFLDNLINLEKICHGQLATKSFSKLRIMKVRNCDRLKHLFSFSMVNNLSQLQEIEVTNCKKLEEIISKESMELVHQNESIRRIEFTQLHTLTLECLPQFTSFSFNASTPNIGSQEIVAEDEADGFMFFSQNVVLPSLKNLKLSSINIRCTWLDQLPVISSCCLALTNLTLEECNGLKFLFSYSVVQSLVQLQNLEVRNCKSIEEIINTEELRGEEKMIMMVFPKLLNLQLKGLPKLARFGSGNSVEFLSLTQISIADCPKLKTFFSCSKYADIKQSKEIEEMICHNDIHPLFDQKVVLPALASINISSIRIQTIWHNQLQPMSPCFQNLKEIIMDGCDTVKFGFPSVAFGLVQLQKLEIKNSAILEAIAVIEEETVTNNLFPNLYELKLVNLPELKSFCNFAGNAIELPSLIHLWIENCPKMQTFISNFTGEDMSTTKDKRLNDIRPLFDEKIRLSNLKFLRLLKMDKLREIWHHQLSSNSFSKLECFCLHDCHNVLNVFPSNMFGRLQKLKGLLCIKSCSSLYEIFELQASGCGKTQAITATPLEKLELNDLPKLKHIWDMDSQGLLSCQNLISIEVIEEETVTNNLFPNLYNLKLVNLPELKSFCNFAGNAIELPCLDALWIENCPKMQTFISNFTGEDMSTTKDKRLTDIHPFFDEKIRLSNLKWLRLQKMDKLREIWHHQLSSNSFSKLDGLGLHDCHNVLNVFPSNMFGRLQKLKGGLWITNCSSLHEIFELQASSCGKTQAITATQLKNLELHDLPKLKHIWDVDSQGLLTCQNLISIDVRGCGSLKSIFPASVGRNLVQLEKLWIEKCCMVEEIFAKGEQVDEAVPRFPRLTFLRLAELPRLRSFYPRVHVSEWPMLKKLQVWKCDKVEVSASNFLSFQVNQGESQQEKPMEQPLLLFDKVPFNNLENLMLDWKSIEKESLHEKLPVYSCKLKVLTFVGFHNEANICVSCFLHKLANLERLQVQQGFFKEIFSFKGFGCEEKHVEAPSKLSSLRLFDLFDSLHLWEENSLSGKVFQNLRILEVVICGNLKCLVPSSVSFKNLTTLEVIKCDGLLNLVAAPTAKSMMQLTKLTIFNCEKIEEIIIHEVDEVEDIIIFKKLSYLELQCLPSLTSFYSGNYITEFPSLEQLVVKECPNMKTFSRGVLRAPRLYGLQITETA